VIGFDVSQQDETVIDLAILDLRAGDKSADEQELPLLFLTKSRSVVCTRFYLPVDLLPTTT
jgi:hypothetical protein